MPHISVPLRAVARAIYETVYPSEEWAPVGFDDAERFGTIHYRQAVTAAEQAAVRLAVAIRSGASDVRGRTRDQLVFRALVVLDEAWEACCAAPVRPTLGIRFALMFLHAIGTSDRSAFDGFWRAIQNEHPDATCADKASYFRAREARTNMTGIARSVGVELTTDYEIELRVARMPTEERLAYRENALRLAEHRRRLVEDGWQ